MPVKTCSPSLIRAETEWDGRLSRRSHRPVRIVGEVEVCERWLTPRFPPVPKIFFHDAGKSQARNTAQ
jgi:hypothetical protein